MALIRYENWEALQVLPWHFTYQLSPYRHRDPEFNWHATYHEARAWCEEQFGPELRKEISEPGVIPGLEMWETDTVSAWVNHGTEWFFNDLPKATYFKLRWC